MLIARGCKCGSTLTFRCMCDAGFFAHCDEEVQANEVHDLYALTTAWDTGEPPT